MATWHNVSKREPCPVCHKPDWCTLSNDGMMCVCKRVPSPHPAKSGQGWVHVLIEQPRRQFIPRMPQRPKVQLFNAEAAMQGYRAEFLAPVPDQPGYTQLDFLAEDIWLDREATDRLRPGMSAFHNAWAFPMLDGNAKCVGIRLREFCGARKWSVSGSRDGLFYDPFLEPREAVYSGLKGKEIVVVEGATDTIAGYELGLPCVGRSSCGTGGEHLRDLCSRLKVGRVTIVTDNDESKFRQDGSRWRPGIDGAMRLAHQLGRLYRIVTPPKKDLREWLQAGLTAKTFWMVTDLQAWKLPTKDINI